MLTDKAALEVEAGAAVDEGTAWIEVTGVARGVETMDSIDVCEEKPYPVSSAFKSQYNPHVYMGIARHSYNQMILQWFQLE